MTTKTAIYLALILGAIYIFLRYVLSYVLPFAIGIFLAFLLEPFVSVISRKMKLRRAKASLVAVVLLVFLLVSLVTWSVTRIAGEITDLYRQLPAYREEFDRVVAEILRVAGDISQQLPEPLARSLQEQWNHLYRVLSVAVSGAGVFVRSVPAFAIMVVFTFLSTYFILKDRSEIRSFTKALLPARSLNDLRNVELDILGGVAGFVRAQSLLIVLTMMVNVVALSFVGSRYAVALGLLLALLDMLPLVGPGLIYLPWIGYQFAWGKATTAIGLLVVYGSVSLLRQVAQTHLVGREMGLHPLAALLSVYVGFRAFGAPGLIYGPLSAILVKGLWASGVIPHESGTES